MLKFIQSIVTHKTINEENNMNSDVICSRLKSKSDHINGNELDSDDTYGLTLDLSSTQQQQQQHEKGVIDYPSVWTEQVWLERKRKHRWLTVSNGCLGCSVCFTWHQQSQPQLGRDLSTDWINCTVTCNGDTKSAQLKSLRAKILRHHQSTAHKEAEKMTQGACTQIDVKHLNVKQHQKMDKIEQRAVIKYLHKKGLTPKEIHEDMCETLGATGPSYAMIKKWVAEFRRGRVSIEDDPRSGRPPRNLYAQPKAC